MKIIYIAGAYRAPTAWAVECNVRRAEAMALRVAEAGFVALCPHTMYRYYNGERTDQYWLDATLELLRRCDAILLLDSWTTSAGSKGEKAEAQSLGLPIFHSLGKLIEAQLNGTI